MNRKMLILACALVTGFETRHAVFAQDGPTDSTEPAIGGQKPVAPGERSEDAANHKRKEGRIETRHPKRHVRVEERDENGDVIRELETEGAPRFERRFEAPDSDRAEVRKERRSFRFGPPGGGEIYVHRFPGPPGELRLPRLPEEPLELGDGDQRARADHIEQAIRHLHEAGLHPLADHLQERLDRARAERRAGGVGDARIREELQRLKEQQEKLQQQLRALQKRLGEARPEKRNE